MGSGRPLSLFGWLPSRAATLALITAAIAWFAHYVRRNTKQDLELEDHENADVIEGRVAAGRAEFDDGVQPYANSGWRDEE